jgi:hypothetical protein
LPDLTSEEHTEYARLVAAAHARLVPARRARVRVHITRATPTMPEAELEHEVTTCLARAERGALEPGHVLYFSNGTSLTAGELAQANALDGRRLADPHKPTYRHGDDAVFHWQDGDWYIVSWAHGSKTVYRLASTTPALTLYQRRCAARIAHFKRRLYADPYFGAPERRGKGIPVATLVYKETSHV